jgi:hypothetical protein
LKAAANGCLAQSRQARKEIQRQKLENDRYIVMCRHKFKSRSLSCLYSLLHYEVYSFFAPLRICGKMAFHLGIAVLCCSLSMHGNNVISTKRRKSLTVPGTQGLLR